MKRVEEAAGHKIVTRTVHMVQDNLLMLLQEFYNPDGSNGPMYFVTLAPADCRELIKDLQEVLRHEEIHVKYNPDCKDGCVCAGRGE